MIESMIFFIFPPDCLRFIDERGNHFCQNKSSIITVSKKKEDEIVRKVHIKILSLVLFLRSNTRVSFQKNSDIIF